MPKKKKKLKN